MKNTSHDELIREQFSKQAVSFAEMKAHSQESAMKLMICAANVDSNSTVLDVACGPGIVASAFAKVTKHVTGIDLTPAMIEQAKSCQKHEGLTNLSWQIGSAICLPYSDSSFDAVVTRYSFHHFQKPEEVLKEMIRVCKPDKRVTVVDVFTSTPEQAVAYDAVETLRDPSHVHALLLFELERLFKNHFSEFTKDFYDLEVNLNEILKASGTDLESAKQVKAIFQKDLSQNQLGVKTCEREGEIYFSFPIVVLSGKK